MVYEWLLALHILAAITWVGGGITGQVLASRMKRDPDRLVRTALDLEWLGTHVYLPASLILLLAGIGMVLEGQWGFTTPWVLIGLIGWGATVVTGTVFLGPQIKKVHAAIEQKGMDDPSVAPAIERLFVLSRIDLAVLILIVLDMAIKPGL